MKKPFFIIIVALFACNLYAQKDSTFYKHEVKASVGDAFLSSIFFTDPWNYDHKNDAFLYVNLSFSYFYRPVKWFWIGGNFINYFGEKINYIWREYENGEFEDLEKSKNKYRAAIAPEIRFSYLNKKNAILFSSISGGVGFENSYYERIPISYYFHLTFFGFSCNFGKNNNIFLGCDVGVGFKGILNFHGGYRF